MQLNCDDESGVVTLRHEARFAFGRATGDPDIA